MLKSVGPGLVFLLLLSQQASALPNPASVFCTKTGGKSEIRTGPKGQYGVCRLRNGRVVEEWSYYRRMRNQFR